MFEEIKKMCKILKTPGILNGYSKIIEKSNGNYSYENFLSEVLKLEVYSRAENNKIKKIRAAKFPVMKRLEDLEFDYLPEDAQNRFEEISSLDFIKNNTNLIMIGNSGTGKSHYSVALGIQACEQGYSVLFKTAANLINELKEAKTERFLANYTKKFSKRDLVIIDELGYISFDTEGAELLFQYLALRYETKSTIITSNLIFSDWIKIFNDQALTMALLDRLTHNSIVLNMNGKSYRRRNK